MSSAICSSAICSCAICGVALVAEALVGYPNRLFRAIGHPVTWIGSGIALLDRHLNRDTDPSSARLAWGAVTVAILLAVCGFAAAVADVAAFSALPAAFAILLLGLLASSCLAQRSLDAHVLAVAEALARRGLAAGRTAVAAIVGRDTAALDEAGVARGAIESLAENFADGVVAPAFWLCLLGLPGGVLYKAINTADSMIGHRTLRHEAFGFCAAKLDDIVNWPAARLAALWLVLAAALVPGASARDAWRVMLRDASGHPSPNAGWPEAAMAGALGVRLGGPRLYAGSSVDDAFIGDGDRRVDAAAIRRALRVYRLACGLEMAVIVGVLLVIGRWR